jgi:hypothetical protein
VVAKSAQRITPTTRVRPCSQLPTEPRHRHVAGREVQRFEPQRRGQHRGVGCSPEQEKAADDEREHFLPRRRKSGRHERADQRADRVRQEREHEMQRPHQGHRGFQAVHGGGVGATGRSDEPAASDDEAHVGGAAEDDAGDGGEGVVQRGVHEGARVKRWRG